MRLSHNRRTSRRDGAGLRERRRMSWKCHRSFARQSRPPPIVGAIRSRRGTKRETPDAGAAVNYLYLAIAILGEVVATSALKASDHLTRPLPSMIVLVGYAVALYFLSY